MNFCAVLAMLYWAFDAVILLETDQKYSPDKLREEENCKQDKQLWPIVPQRLAKYCPALFDGILCWPHTELGMASERSCPKQFTDEVVPRPGYMVRLLCQNNGSWNTEESMSSYVGCLFDNLEEISVESGVPSQVMFSIYATGYISSIVSVVLGIFVITKIRSLWCTRNIIHVNLFACYGCFGVIWFIRYFLALSYDKDQTTSVLFHSVACYVASCLLNFVSTAAYFWMFVEGFYLFMGAVFPFVLPKIRFCMLAIIGWVLPILLVILPKLALVSEIESTFSGATNETLECGTGSKNFDDIFLVPAVVILCVNLVFLIAVIVVLKNKSNIGSQTERKRQIRVLRAMMILIPLLGTNKIILLYTPLKPKWVLVIWSYSVSISSSTQGLFVAVLFCFMNKEVLAAVHRAMKRRSLTLTTLPVSAIQQPQTSRINQEIVDEENEMPNICSMLHQMVYATVSIAIEPIPEPTTTSTIHIPSPKQTSICGHSDRMLSLQGFHGNRKCLSTGTLNVLHSNTISHCGSPAFRCLGVNSKLHNSRDMANKIDILVCQNGTVEATDDSRGNSMMEPGDVWL